MTTIYEGSANCKQYRMVEAYGPHEHVESDGWRLVERWTNTFLDVKHGVETQFSVFHTNPHRNLCGKWVYLLQKVKDE